MPTESVNKNSDKRGWKKIFRNTWAFCLVGSFISISVFIALIAQSPNTSSILPEILALLFICLAFLGGIAFVLWLFAVNRKVSLFLLLFLLLLYVLGIVKARRQAQPFQNALETVNKADAMFNNPPAAKDTTIEMFLETDRKYVSLYAKAASIDLSGVPGADILQGYISENYQWAKELAVVDEAQLTGKTKLTEQQLGDSLKDFTERRKSILVRYRTYARVPSWMCFFLVYSPTACWVP